MGIMDPTVTNVESESSTTPWAEQIPYLLGGFEAAKNIYNMGAPAYYPGETLAGFDPYQQMAHKSIIDYSTSPRASGMMSGAESALMRALSGYTGFSGSQMSDLLAGNVRTGAGTPYTQMENALTEGVMNNLNTNILPGIRANQVMSGQYGGSTRGDLVNNKAVSDAVTSGLTRPLADMYSSAYNQAQQMRLPAAQMGVNQMQYGLSQYPTTLMAPYGVYNQIGQVGAERRAMTQAAIDRDMARYEYEANAPMNALKNYMAMVTGDYGSTTTATTPLMGPSRMSQFGQILGLGLTGLRLAGGLPF